MHLLDPFKLPKQNVSFSTKVSRYFYKNKFQDSAGTITYYKEPGSQIPLFLQFYVSEDGKTGEWWFPKGIVEKIDRNFEDRALQETKEEVGLDVELLTRLSSNTYVFYWDKGKIKFTKTVHYFLAKSLSNNVELAKYSTEQSEKDHFKEFSWSQLEDAVNKTKHEKEKELLKEAYSYINEHPIDCLEP